MHKCIENYRGSDVDVLLVKMMPPSWRQAFALVGHLNLLVIQSNLFLNNSNVVSQQIFVHC